MSGKSAELLPAAHLISAATDGREGDPIALTYQTHRLDGNRSISYVLPRLIGHIHDHV
jgi:hypothetical protein